MFFSFHCLYFKIILILTHAVFAFMRFSWGTCTAATAAVATAGAAACCVEIRVRLFYRPFWCGLGVQQALNLFSAACIHTPIPQQRLFRSACSLASLVYYYFSNTIYNTILYYFVGRGKEYIGALSGLGGAGG